MNLDDQTTKLLRSMDAAPVSEIDSAQSERAQAAKSLIMAENPAAQVPAVETVRGKPKRKSLTIAIAGLFAACGIAAGGTLVAVAGDDRDPTEPALSVAGESFYPADDLDVAWASAVESYPAALPEGVEFPMGAPDFFRPTDLVDGDQPVFQAGLVDGFVTTYWKCAWTEEKILSEKAGDLGASGEADRALSDIYPGLPGAMPEQPNQAEYEQGLADEAATLGVTPAEVEFSRDCSFYSDTAGTN